MPVAPSLPDFLSLLLFSSLSCPPAPLPLLVYKLFVVYGPGVYACGVYARGMCGICEAYSSAWACATHVRCGNAGRHEWWVPGKILETRRRLQGYCEQENGHRDALMMDCALENWFMTKMTESDKVAPSPPLPCTVVDAWHDAWTPHKGLSAHALGTHRSTLHGRSAC